jgi:hypothetical protein
MIKKTLEIKDEQAVFVDSKTNARSIALPFRFPDGVAGVCIISRLKDQTWEPKEIKNIIVSFK